MYLCIKTSTIILMHVTNHVCIFIYVKKISINMYACKNASILAFVSLNSVLNGRLARLIAFNSVLFRPFRPFSSIF
jgi:hypothetical protein